MQTFLGTRTPSDSDYYDSKEPIIIAVTTTITDKDLVAVSDEEHRERLKSAIKANVFKLTYTAAIGQKAKLTRTGSEPKNVNWRTATFDEVVAGKKGADLKTSVEQAYPDLKAAIAAKNPPPKAQKDFREVFDGHVASFGEGEFQDRDDLPLPTGIDASVKALFPDVIFVPAVRDVSSDMGTAGSSAFGKLIGLLLNSISGEIATFKSELAKLDAMLNVKTDASGKTEDKRLQQVRDLEKEVQIHLQESFPTVSVKLSIPPPEPKLILQRGQILFDDAVPGPVETKGDGLKRAVIFALLRAYSELAKRPEWNPNAAPGKHILMFEEPEIFLHPTAQKLLFEALHAVSSGMQVIVTTHSPLFFSASRTNAFSKLVKEHPNNGRPFSDLVSIDFQKKLPLKTQFQVLCYENHNAAFFADAVVLVEGDTDVTALQHIALALNPDWDFEEGRVRLVKVGGKGNFGRFADFFSHFKIKTMVVADLDCIVHGFGELPLAADSPLKARQAALHAQAAALCPEYQADAEQANTTWREAGARLRGIITKANAGQAIDATDQATMDWMEGKLGRNRALVDTLATNATLRAQKLELLRDLRVEGIIVWDKGCIEDYYGFPVAADKKTEGADKFRSTVTTKEAVLALAQTVPDGVSGNTNEFLAIFERLFAPTAIVHFDQTPAQSEAIEAVANPVQP